MACKSGDEHYIAHVRENEDGSFKTQCLLEHLTSVADFAKDFADCFAAGDWAEFMGSIHDLGKAAPGWQKALRKETGYDLDSFIETDGGKGNHSTLGAVFAQNSKLAEWYKKAMAYVVAGHHAGLPDWEPGGEGACLQIRIFGDDAATGIDRQQLDLLNEIQQVCEIEEFLNNLSMPRSNPLSLLRTLEKPSSEAVHLWIRMLFSCVVDADYLDTERFMSSEKFAMRGNYPKISELKGKLDRCMHEKSLSAKPSAINDLRWDVLRMCREKALMQPGFFTLSVPTGAGKTLASMSFALDHAIKWNKQRVIVGIPYTSIIEQTAKVYKYGTDRDDEIANGAVLLGEQGVVEHHSNLDPEKETQSSRLATENWDAPVIVTTNVQLFESLAASKPSACRKLHNIANSVIILDEAQLLPTPYLLSILANLKHLVEYFGVTVLFCTATQPALVGEIGSGKAAFHGIESATEIYDHDRAGLYESFKRVTFHVPRNDERHDEWQSLADELNTFERVLCVVNTRQSARDLHALMPKGTFHLSALMCAEDRSDTIAAVKRCLRNEGQSVRLISTQLVEAGVDIDFPVVYRAFAGIDSIVQSAGRCNREGKMPVLGKVVIFNPPISSPRGLLAKGEETARLILDGQSSFTLSDELFRQYFHEFYRKLNEFDKPCAKKMMLDNGHSCVYPYRTYAKHYHLIDDQAQRSIIVPYHSEETGRDSNPLIEELERRDGYDLIRKLQRFTVTVPERIFHNMWENGLLRTVGEGQHIVLSSPNSYKPGIGLMCKDAIFWEALII